MSPVYNYSVAIQPRTLAWQQRWKQSCNVLKRLGTDQMRDREVGVNDDSNVIVP